MKATEHMSMLILDAQWRSAGPALPLVDWRALAACLLARDARWLLLAQRRPHAVSARPNNGDIALTRALRRRLTPLDMVLTDHVIDAGRDRFSFRAAGLL